MSGDCKEYHEIVIKTFVSEEDGFNFYNSYALEKGFSMRRSYVEWDEANKKIILRKFVCSREGCREEKHMKRKRADMKRRPWNITRVGCKAKLVIARAEETWQCQSRLDYKAFGDVVVFDSTYWTNKYNLPFVPFVGLNHHRSTVIFGCGIISHETMEAYEWMLDVFSEARSQKHPISVITDGDLAMQRAIRVIWPDSNHKLCVWHIQQNIVRHLSDDKVKEEFRSFIYDSSSIDEHESKWLDLLERNKVTSEESWLHPMYQMRKLWVSLVYCLAGQISSGFCVILKPVVCSNTTVEEVVPVSTVIEERKPGSDTKSTTVTVEEDVPLSGLNMQLKRVQGDACKTVDKGQRWSLFQTQCYIKGKACKLMVDGGSYTNGISKAMVTALGLSTWRLPEPKRLEWLNSCGMLKITHKVRVPFAVDDYVDEIDCDVLPLEVCGLLLGRPWQYDRNVTHVGRANTYSFMHGGKQRTLKPMGDDHIKSDVELVVRKEKLHRPKVQLDVHDVPSIDVGDVSAMPVDDKQVLVGDKPDEATLVLDVDYIWHRCAWEEWEASASVETVDSGTTVLGVLVITRFWPNQEMGRQVARPSNRQDVAGNLRDDARCQGNTFARRWDIFATSTSTPASEMAEEQIKYEDLPPEHKKKYDELKAIVEAELIGSFEKTHSHDIRFKGFTPQGVLEGLDLSLPSEERTRAL
ncbi:hypothetical protein QYE76_041661 [Lolium multiflorum]|uniref:Protein FAR1-RELATED SEQUENCE n=1 Tax=Lolium multiflorum TaxID=4521 RepID=A0AAD8TFR0_LOLMU|nr:hypothetical protein QYE76_041661 [Lolium multiflorum]